MKVDLNGKTAVVTGGSGGIGSAMVKALAENGAYVYICDINDENGKIVEDAVKEKGGQAKYIHCDITSDESCRAFVDEIIKERGTVDFLMNNAGGNIALERRGKIRDYEEAAWDFTIDVCMDGMYRMNKYIIPVMKKQGGAIVNTGSVTGFRAGLRNQCAYNLCKAAIHNLTRTQAIEYAQYGITVNSVIPGTTWHENFYKGLNVTDELKNKFLSHVPLGVPNVPADMANAALYFCSPEAKRTTGVLMNVDGGWAAGYCRK